MKPSTHRDAEAHKNAASYKKRAESGDLTATYQAYERLLTLWGRNQADPAKSRNYFDAALSGRALANPRDSVSNAAYLHFKTGTLLPQLEAYAHGQYIDETTLKSPHVFHPHNAPAPLSAFNRLALHRVRRLYELHFRHTQSPHSADKLQKIKQKLALHPQQKL